MQNILAQFVFVFFPVFLPGADLKITEPPERKTHTKKNTNMQSTLAHFLFVLFVFHIVLSDLFFLID